jgi:hypothetical protein
MRDAVTTKIVALARSGKNARVGAGCESSLVSPRAHRPLAAPLDPALGGVYVALPDPEL